MQKTNFSFKVKCVNELSAASVLYQITLILDYFETGENFKHNDSQPLISELIPGRSFRWTEPPLCVSLNQMNSLNDLLILEPIRVHIKLSPSH